MYPLFYRTLTLICLTQPVNLPSQAALQHSKGGSTVESAGILLTTAGDVQGNRLMRRARGGRGVLVQVYLALHQLT
jgi:hypothetical protein